MNNKVKIAIKSIIAAFFIGLSLYVSKVLYDLEILPMKFISIIYLFIGAFNVFSIITLFKKGVWNKIFSSISYLVIIAISILGINYGTATLDFFNKAFNNNKKEINTYNVISLKSSKYKELADLKDKTLGYLWIDDNKDESMKIVSSKVSTKNYTYNDLYEMYEALLNKKVESLLIDGSYIEVLEEQYNDIFEQIKIIYSFEIEKVNKEKNDEVDELKPINILISGSDSRSGQIYNKTRSDVNMILTLNPKNKTILMTSIPRDYYVSVYGKTGLNDKLTHTGIYGVETTKKTIENLLDIHIDYTIKVGFQSVIKLVDMVGGIDIVSDKEFTTWCGDGGAERVNVKKGNNHFTGAQALSYARERHAYASGDRHRVLNQQQVLEAVFNAIFNDKKILTKYEGLLDSLSDLYRTDMPRSVMSLLIKKQLDEMTPWTFDSYSLNGSGASLPTYTAPNSHRYVMIPNEKTIKEANKRIKEALK